jgi:hypothetical protein
MHCSNKKWICFHIKRWIWTHRFVFEPWKTYSVVDGIFWNYSYIFLHLYITAIRILITIFSSKSHIHCNQMTAMLFFQWPENMFIINRHHRSFSPRIGWLQPSQSNTPSNASWLTSWYLLSDVLSSLFAPCMYLSLALPLATFPSSSHHGGDREYSDLFPSRHKIREVLDTWSLNSRTRQQIVFFGPENWYIILINNR